MKRLARLAAVFAVIGVFIFSGVTLGSRASAADIPLSYAGDDIKIETMADTTEIHYYISISTTEYTYYYFHAGPESMFSVPAKIVISTKQLFSDNAYEVSYSVNLTVEKSIYKGNVLTPTGDKPWQVKLPATFIIELAKNDYDFLKANTWSFKGILSFGQYQAYYLFKSPLTDYLNLYNFGSRNIVFYTKNEVIVSTTEAPVVDELERKTEPPLLGESGGNWLTDFWNGLFGTNDSNGIGSRISDFFEDLLFYFVIGLLLFVVVYLIVRLIKKALK